MTMTKEKTSSPLGDKAQLYTVKSSSRGAIMDHPGEGYLEFYPSGYSKDSRRDGQPRQHIHRQIYEAAVARKTEEKLYPFDNVEHTLQLIPDIKNPVDPNALWVVLHSPHGILRQCHDMDIGFVPAEIAPVLKANLDKIIGGQIYKVRANWYKKFYSCKIILHYGDSPLLSEDPSLGRFADIILEA